MKPQKHLHESEFALNQTQLHHNQNIIWSPAAAAIADLY